MRFVAFLSFFEHSIANALFRVSFNVARSSLTGQALTLRNGRRHSLLGRHSRRHLAVQLGRRGSRVEGRASGHAHFARLRSNLLRLDTTATRTRQAAASDDRQHRAKKKNVPPRVTVNFADFPECFSALPSRGKTSPRHITHHVRIRIYITHRNSERAPLNCLCDLRSPATDTATARSSPAEDGATNPRRRTALDAR